MIDAPPGLGEAGVRLWEDMHAVLPEGFGYDEKELTLLTMACRQMDDIAALEAALATDGVIVTGSQGQPIMSKVVTELRGQRESVARLLRQIETDPEASLSPSEKARAAARSRWGARAAPNNRTQRVLPEAK